MARFTVDEVKIGGNYQVGKILELSMNLGVNRHGFLTYGGLVSEDEAKDYIMQSAERQAVKVFIRNELEFCGYPYEITSDYQNDHCYVRVTLATSSQLMDSEPCSRFFQDSNQTCSMILNETYSDSNCGNLVAVHADDRALGPILQYQETDWMFTLRMAGILNTIVITDATFDTPRIMLGTPNRQSYSENNELEYALSRGNSAFNQKYTVNRQSSLSYQIKSENRYKLGDSILMDGQAFTVMEKSFVNVQSEVQEIYILGNETGYAVPFYHNQHISGLELEGRVLERSGEKMRLLLDIDARRKNGGETWFSYSPVTNNGMYSMPLENEKVMLKWQGEEDSDTLIVRPERKNSREMLSPGERHFQTEHKNYLMMIQNKVEYTNPVGSIKWLANKGFDLSSGKNIVIAAQQDVVIQSQAQIDASSPERITICKAGVESSIDMISNELHIKAVKKIKAASKANKFKKSKLPERTPQLTVNTSTVSKLAAAIPHVSNAK